VVGVSDYDGLADRLLDAIAALGRTGRQQFGQVCEQLAATEPADRREMIKVWTALADIAAMLGNAEASVIADFEQDHREEEKGGST
jgi:hypothetical protein